MSADFTIVADPGRDLIRIRMAGFFGPEDIRRFLEVRRAAHARLTCGPNQHLTLNDIRDMKIQAGEIVEGFRQLLADPAYHSRRLAFIVSPTLARSQLVRAIHSRDARCFEDPWEAEAWLYTGLARDAA